MKLNNLTIPRDEWYRGGDKNLNDTTPMLNDIGLRCCLGHLGRTMNVPDSVLLHTGSPLDSIGWSNELYSKYDPNDLLVHLDGIVLDNTEFTIDAMNINDNPDISEDEREQQVIELFATKGITVNFVDTLKGL